MSAIKKLRAKAAHARLLAQVISDTHDRAALRAIADELERKAAEMERPEVT